MRMKKSIEIIYNRKKGTKAYQLTSKRDKYPTPENSQI